MAASATAPLPLRLPRDGRAYPLSPAQERLWFLDRLLPESSVYNIPTAIKLAGAFDLTIAEQALSELVRRHEALRTTFVDVDGAPAQMIQPPDRVALELEDLSEVRDADRGALLERRLLERSSVLLDLERGPVFAAGVFRLGTDEHVLLLLAHHIASDGWSTDLLVEEFGLVYTALANGRRSPLPEPALQYVDYAAWQRELLASDAFHDQVAFWRRQLENAPTALELVTDRPRPPLQTYRGARESVLLDSASSGALEELVLAEGVTLHMAVVAGFAAVLARWSGQSEVCLGTLVSGRSLADFERVVGFFVNTLVLRCDLRGDPSFRELLVAVRETAIDAYDNQDVPFQQVVEQLHPERDLSRTPLFQALVAFQHDESSPLRMPGVEAEEIIIGTQTAKFDIGLAVEEVENGLRATLEYNTDIFDGWRMRSLLGSFARLVAAAVERPGDRISKLTMLGVEEERSARALAHGPRRTVASQTTLHRLFRDQARRTPDVAAIVESDGSAVTYGALDEATDRLARHLRRHGVRREVLVAICLERSTAFIASVLATLKAGGAWLPLDPSDPPERLRSLLVEASPGLVVADEAAATRIREICEAPVLVLDEAARSTAEGSLPDDVLPTNLAYVIYTSGSTGRPRGVMVEHRSVVNLLENFRDQLNGIEGLRSQPLRVAFSLSPVFDASVQQLLHLLLGNTLYTVSDALKLDPDRFGAWIEQNEIDVLNGAPSYVRLLLEHGLLRTTRRTAQALFVGGERIDPGLWQDLVELERVEAFNHYGPTECTVDAAVAAIHAPEPTIGRPVGNVQTHILDGNLAPVPRGMPGQMFIGGAGVSRGYLGRPGLTAERFVPDPFSADGSRMYATGDRGAYGEDGAIVFLGRSDRQLKIRGYRIEPREIEEALLEDPALSEAAVAVDTTDSERLIAFVVARSEVTGQEILGRLAERLPRYMLPWKVVVVDAMPVGPSGKIDGKRLLALHDARTSDTPRREPSSESERALTRIWKEILGVASVSPADNFFELGGHSLSAARVVARVRSELLVPLPITAVFTAPSLGDLAARIDAAQESRCSPTHIPQLAPAERAKGVPLSWGQQRLWFLDQLEPGNPAYHLPLALRLCGSLDERALRRALTEIIRRHEVLRTSIGLSDEFPVQKVGSPNARLEVRDVRHMRSEEIDRLVEDLIREPFDLEAGIVIRSWLLRTGDDEHILLVSMHHVASDGESLRNFRRELGMLYSSFASGVESSLEELPVQYGDFAAWQRGRRDRRANSADHAYWSEKLAGAPTTLDLHLAAPAAEASADAEDRGHCVIVATVDTYDAATRLCREHDLTLFMAVLAALSVVLSWSTEADDFCIGAPFSHRPDPDLEPLIGYFLNTLVLRCDLTGDPTGAELLERIRITVLEAFEHQETQFEELVELVNPPRDVDRPPLVQVMLNVHQPGSPDDKLIGLDVHELDLPVGESKLDLTVHAHREGETVQLEAVYNARRLDGAAVEDLLVQLEAVIRKLADDSGQSLSQLRSVLGEPLRLG